MSQNTPTHYDRQQAMDYAVRLCENGHANWNTDSVVATAEAIAEFLAGDDGKADKP